MKATRSLISTPPFEAESLDKLGTSTGVTTGRSTQQSTLFRKLYSIVTPTRTSRTMTKRLNTVPADSQTITRPSPLQQMSAPTVDPGSGPSKCLIKFNNKVEKELDVEITHKSFHGASISCVKFSRDGKYLAAGCKDGKTYIYDVQGGILTQ